MSTFTLIALAGAALLACPVSAQDPAAVTSTTDAATALRRPTTFRVTMRDGLRFDPPRLSAKPGDEIVIDLENADTTHQVHNFIVVQPGKREEVVKLSMELGEKGPERQFVPPGPEIVVHSTLLEPEKRQRIRFKLPEQPGVYPYVCTFPGHGMIMYGALYAGVPMPPMDQDPNLPPTLAQTMAVGGGRRPFVQRMFMPNAGPAAIAVALPGDQNYCWDAGQCRLRYVWTGGFIDASEHWRGKGDVLAKLAADPWWRAPMEDFPLRFGSSDAAPPRVTFLGYRLEEGVPEFHYRADEVEIAERITAVGGHGAVAIRFRVREPKHPVFVRLSQANEVKWTASTGEIFDGVLRLTPEQAADFTLTLAAAVVHAH